MIGCYCRVSTEDQNLDRQLAATSDYAGGRLGAESADFGTHRDRSTGTDTSQSHFSRRTARSGATREGTASLRDAGGVPSGGVFRFNQPRLQVRELDFRRLIPQDAVVTFAAPGEIRGMESGSRLKIRARWYDSSGRPGE